MFVSMTSKKGYTNNTSGDTRQAVIVPKDMDDDDMFSVDIKQLFTPITVHIVYTSGIGRILTLKKFQHAKFRITKQLKDKIERIIISDTPHFQPTFEEVSYAEN